MGAGQSALHGSSSQPLDFQWAHLRSMGESSPNLLRPADEGPIASPPPRPSSRSGQSTPSPTKVPLLPIVATTARTEENGHTQRRQSVRADSPMPGPPTGQPILRKGVFLHEDSVLDGNNKLQGSDIEDLDSQIREIQQNTDDILENIEDEIFGDDVEMPYVTNPTVTKCENQGTFPYENVQSNARVPPGGTFEKDMFVDKEGFLPLGRQLPPTRSTHNRRASVPREHALRNKQRKFLSRTTVPDVRGPSMPGAFGVPERIREQVQRRLNTTHAATTHGSHTNRQTRSESDHWTAEQTNLRGDLDFQKYRHANERLSRLTGSQTTIERTAKNKGSLFQQQSSVSNDIPPHPGRSTHRTYSDPVSQPPQYDLSEELILEDIEKEFSVT